MGNKLFQSYFVVRPYILFNHQQFNLSYGFHSSSDTHSSHSIVKPKVSDERYTLKPQLPLSIAWQNDRVFSVYLYLIYSILYFSYKISAVTFIGLRGNVPKLSLRGNRIQVKESFSYIDESNG